MANPPGIQRALEYGIAHESDVRGLLRQRAAAPIKPRKPQQPCDVGLFSDDADQLDLVSFFTEQSEQ